MSPESFVLMQPVVLLLFDNNCLRYCNRDDNARHSSGNLYYYYNICMYLYIVKYRGVSALINVNVSYENVYP